MKKLLNTLYVTSADSYLALEGETIVIMRPEQDNVRIPMHNVESVYAFGYTGVSPALMGALCKENISLCFLNQNGKFLARVTGESRGNVLLRKQQYRVSDSEGKSLVVAKNIIAAKLYNSKWILHRALRDHSMRIDANAIAKSISFLHESIAAAQNAQSLDQLRGVEGDGAKQYFSVFDQLILQQKESFQFSGRNRRPPKDNVNAMLSFGYTLLANDVAAALEGVGLDAYAGFLHRDRPGRASLALDMMEEMRGWMVDRFVLSLINKKVVAPKGFKKEQSGGVVMSDETRNTFLQAWQQRKKEEITHPFLEEKIQWGLLPHAQALLLARYLREDLDAYPVFLWK